MMKTNKEMMSEIKQKFSKSREISKPVSRNLLVNPSHLMYGPRYLVKDVPYTRAGSSGNIFPSVQQIFEFHVSKNQAFFFVIV